MNSNNLKITIVILISGLLGSLPNLGMSQNPRGELSTDDGGKYATLVRKIPPIKASVKTARQMKVSEQHRVDSFQVIICGKVVKALDDRPEIRQTIRKGRKENICFLACGLSMNKFGIEASALTNGISVIPNGISHLFDLQERGYRTVEL